MHIKQTIKKMLPPKIFGYLRDIVYPEKIHTIERRLGSFFCTYYKDVASPFLNQKVAFKNAEFKVHSKHGCDGMLLHIFSKIGTVNYTFVEMGIQDGTECNTANLAINFGWKGLLIDAEINWVKSARQYYENVLGSMSMNVRIAECFVTAESINPLLTENKILGEIELLSIDIDSNDYWVWKSISTINPRVVVIEYNAAYGSTRSMTIKYDSEFHFKNTARENPLYFGASLTALTKLGKEKGYVLVACDTQGHDAYFVRSDVAEGKFIALSPAEAFYPNPYTIGAIGNLETQYESIKHLDFEEI
jgi:hypothetical protein